MTAPAAMQVQVTYWYIAATTARTMYVKANLDPPVVKTPAATVDWDTPKSDTATLTLKAGVNSIEFYNPTSANAPDLDRISVSGA